MNKQPGSEAPQADPRRWKALGVLALSLSLIVLDGSIVSVALPDIISDLKLSITNAQWVNSLYAVIFSALLLLSGRLGDRFGRRTMLIIGIFLFVGSSMWAGLATGASSLIMARFVQGIGGALIMPSTLSTVNATFRGKERAAAFGIWGAVMSGAAAVGPLLGGWLTTSFSWRWIFYVNLPLGLLIVVGALAWVANTRAQADPSASGTRGHSLDIPGALLSGGAFGLIVFGIIESTSLGWWREKLPLEIFGREIHGPAGLSIVPAVLLIGVSLLACFLAWEKYLARNVREVLLDLTLFRIPTFRWGNLTAMAVAVGEFGLIFILPLYLVNVRALSTLQAGLVLVAMACGAFVSGAAARHIAGRLGAPLTVVLGLFLEVVGLGVLAFILRPDGSLAAVTLLLVVYGFGLGIASAQLTSTILADVPTDQSGQGSATQSTARQIGSAIGASVAGALLAGTISRIGAGFTGREAAMAKAVHDSAGSALQGLRAQHVPGALLANLDAMFTDASRVAIFGAVFFLVLGLLGAIQVARVSRA
ncbi:MFS transporter [Dermabacteraceae bacterium TAE3-ERU27]|nr:MFS transporter [Dermabacteraceae bacterium TAE3-ERU27]